MLNLRRNATEEPSAGVDDEPPTGRRPRNGFKAAAEQMPGALNSVQGAVENLTTAALAISLVSLFALLMAGWALARTARE